MAKHEVTLKSNLAGSAFLTGAQISELMAKFNKAIASGRGANLTKAETLVLAATLVVILDQEP